MKYPVLFACALCLVSACDGGHEAQRASNAQAASATPPVQATPPPSEEKASAAPEHLTKIPETATRSDSGLAWEVLRAGNGEQHPRPYDVVQVHYTAWTARGTLFDSTRRRKVPATLTLDQAIAGWREGIALMVPGEIRRLWIPKQLAYGGREGWPQENLVFDLELVAIEQRPQPAASPPSVGVVPTAAQRTKSGLSWIVLEKGEGKIHPTGSDVVVVSYDGWNEAGELFDSTFRRGGPATFALDQAIAGWKEGIPMMVVGEKRRFWIPANLAYLGREGQQGTLTFDLELLEIQPGRTKVGSHRMRPDDPPPLVPVAQP